MTAPGPNPPARRAEAGQISRRSIWTAALAMIIALLGGVLLVALLSDPDEPAQEPAATAGAQGESPNIIDKPNSGTAPDDPGDRGGWEQLALLGLIVAAIGCIGVIVFRGGGAKAKANRAAWLEASQADHDGAID